MKWFDIDPGSGSTVTVAEFEDGKMSDSPQKLCRRRPL
jgi:hypothetical protein